MRKLVHVVLAVSLMASTACYHAIIETGRPASADRITIPWAHSFIYGLVPPKVVDASAKCKSGVSKVETQHSFLNSLVGGITWGIYTPLTITVTCAQGGRASLQGEQTVPVGSDANQAFQKAIELAKESGKAAYVQF